MAHTTRTTLDRPAAGRSLHVSSFDRVRAAVRNSPALDLAQPARPVGSAPARDAQRDLQMFVPHGARPVVPIRGEELAPLLPPVISDPLRPRRAAVHAFRAAPAAPRERLAPAPAPVRSRVRVTLRGYAAILGFAVVAIAGTSAISTAGAEASASVATTEVVARAGETTQDVAARSAQGRDVAELAAAIEAANGLAHGATLSPGEIVLVPGS